MNILIRFLKSYIVLRRPIAYILVLIAVGIGFFFGVRATEELEQTIRDQFSDDVIEVRQGKLAGWAIHTTDNASLSEEWEELTSDVIKYAGDLLEE